MRITVLCSDANHPVNGHLERWTAAAQQEHEVSLVRRRGDLQGGDILFLVSCGELIGPADRAAYGATLVLHASDLPLGRGWSPHVWQIANGSRQITLSLLEAAEPVDSGSIWAKKRIDVPPGALWDEINRLLFDAELELMDFAVANYRTVTPLPQASDVQPTHWRRRTPEDSRLDPHRSLAEQFDLLRVCDPGRYPAFFELHGRRYKVVLEAMDQ